MRSGGSTTIDKGKEVTREDPTKESALGPRDKDGKPFEPTPGEIKAAVEELASAAETGAAAAAPATPSVADAAEGDEPGPRARGSVGSQRSDPGGAGARAGKKE